MALLSAISDYFAGLVHASAADDEVAAARHRTFILSHLAGGVLAFTAFPLVLLARGGPPSVVEIAILAWLVAPILAALDLSRTGNLERAHFISTASLAGLIFAVALMTGGITSFALVWLPIVAFEAAFSGSRRVIVASLGVAVLVVILLTAMEVGGMLHPTASAVPKLVPGLAALMGVIYAAGLALRWDGIQRTVAGVRQSSEARYKLLAENMTDLVTRHAPNGAVSFASPAAERILGASAVELQGRGFFERVHVADRPAYLTALSEAGRGTAAKSEFRIRKLQTDAENLYSAQPQFVWVEMQCRPGEGDQAGHVIAVTREISDRKEQQGTVEQSRVEADRAHAAKGKFLASMSHELRTPLNAIIGFSELLANEEFAARDEKRRQEYAGLIHDSGLHLLSVVNGILDMSRIESGNFAIVSEPFDVRPVIDSSVQLFALKAKDASVRLEADIPDNLPELMADKRALKQILINLLSNAIKFTPPAGAVTVAVREEGEMVRIEVSDTGVGIAADDIPNLGNSFFQARSSYDRPFEGTGLGLSVVKGLIGLQGGSFDVTSEIGKGTCVIVRLPRDRSEATTDKSDIQSPPQRRAAIG
jgi:cell cycle sensor histidine kinase DivJ